MDCKTCFVLIGILAFTNGRPAKDDSSFVINNEDELQELLKTLYNDGKFDIALSHHRDGPNSHHEDTAHFSHHDKGSHEYHHHHDGVSHEHKHKDLVRPQKHTEIDEHPTLTNIQTLNLFYKKKANEGDDNNKEDDEIEPLEENEEVVRKSKSGSRGMDQITKLLNELEKKVKRAKSDVRCSGDRCGKYSVSEDNRDDDSNSNRDDCIGDRCGRGRSDDSNDRICFGDRCGRGRNDRVDQNDKDDSDRLACIGDRCGRGRNDDSNDRICFGDRCGRGRNDQVDQNSRVDSDRLACFGDRCGRGRNDDANDRLCEGDRCGRFRDDDKSNSQDSNRNIFRCSGSSCSIIDQTLLRERRLPNGDRHIADLFNSRARKIKINDNLDAIVLDVSDLDNSLGQIRAQDLSEKQQNVVQSLQNIDISNLLDDKDDDDEENATSEDVLDSKSQPVEAVVIDLSKAQNDVSDKVKILMQNLQSPRGFRSLKIDLSQKVKRGDSKILSHNEDNNNVYVPKWLLKEVLTNSDLRGQAKRSPKNLLPLTAKQKQKLVNALLQKNDNNIESKRIFRRSVEEDIGVPFHLQVQGLGQAEPS